MGSIEKKEAHSSSPREHSPLRLQSPGLEKQTSSKTHKQKVVLRKVHIYINPLQKKEFKILHNRSIENFNV